jgi:LysM repeat protein
MQVNDLRTADDLEAGMVLRIPGGAEPGELEGAPAPARSSGTVSQPALAPEPEVEAAKAPRIHRVRQGETLMGISRAYGVSVDDIRRENGIRGDKITIGQTLRIP